MGARECGRSSNSQQSFIYERECETQPRTLPCLKLGEITWHEATTSLHSWKNKKVVVSTRFIVIDAAMRTQQCSY
jgi:hypothetical protein